MFKLPGIPSPQSEPHELADFAEWLALKHGSTSSREILAALGRHSDNANNEGCDDDSDELSDELDEVMNEIERRSIACGGAYPFKLKRVGTALQHEPATDNRSIIYIYLLLATRLNMQQNRVHNCINGTVLLEELGAHVLVNYVGGTATTDTPTGYGRARGIVFGTGNPGDFKDKVNDLCALLGEGGAFRALDPAEVDENDDKLDVVAWVPFSDQKKGLLILYGQCKTGTSWDSQKTQLQPTAFIKRWMRDPYLYDPARVFIISEASDRAQWCGDVLYAGLLFDRCRIVDFCHNVKEDLLERIKEWNRGAQTSVA